MNHAAVLERRKESVAAHLMARSAEVAVIRNGHIELPIDPEFLGPRLGVIRAGMKKITETPELQEAFPFRVAGTDAYGDRYNMEVGLRQRNDRERKWWFQYMPKAYLAPSPAQRKTGAFLGALHDLDKKAIEIAIALAECFDARNRRKNTSEKYDGSMAQRIRNGSCITRVLRYLSVDTVASAYPHVDRAAFTVHWGATHEGLVVFGPSGDRMRVRERSNDIVAVFPGEKFAAISRGSLGLGTPHGVKRDREANEDRYAFVSFVHPEAVDGDVAWLLAHRSEIEERERSLSL